MVPRQYSYGATPKVPATGDIRPDEIAGACSRREPLPAGAAGKVIAYAEAQLGKPYLWGAAGRTRLTAPGWP